MNRCHDTFVRAHTVQLEKKQHKSTRQHNQPKWPDYVLIFDCESRVTADLTLTFGFWRFCELRGNEYVCTEEGIFHDDAGLKPKEFAALRNYVKTDKPDTVEDGCDRLRRYSPSGATGKPTLPPKPPEPKR